MYSFLFGLFVKVAGLGWRQCAIFDALIRMVLAYLLGRAAGQLGGQSVPASVRWQISMGYFLFHTRLGRPDALALCFGMTGLVLLADQQIEWKKV